MQDNSGFIISSPLVGVVKSLSIVPDEAFSQGFLGPGLALEPISNIIKAPISGTIKSLHKSLHAIVIENNGVEILIHIGVETVALNGGGFKALCKQGDKVAKGAPLVEFDIDYINKNAPSSLVIVLAASEQDPDALELAPEGEIKEGDFLFSIKGKSAAQETQPTDNSGEIIKQNIVINAKNGLHARPAAAIAKAINAFDGTLVFLSKGEKTANAKSMVEILSLGINYGDDIEFSAQGKYANEALSAAICAAQEPQDNPVTIIPAVKNSVIPDFSGEVKLNAQGVYPGLIIGKACHLSREQFEICEKAEAPAEEELKKLLSAVDRVKSKIKEEISSCKGNESRIEILKAHLIMLDDPFLLSTSKEFIASGKSAAYSCHKAVEKGIEFLEKSQNDLLRERKADYKDMENRILSELFGKCSCQLSFAEDTILITDELLSSEVCLLGSNVKGIVMAGGSPTSHIAIMLKNISLPSVISAGAASLAIPAGATLILDSVKGFVTVNPVNIESVKREQQACAAIHEKALSTAFEPAITKDGTLIEVKGNIGNLEEAVKVDSFGSDGLGLVRSEFLFSSYRAAPSEEEQYSIYQSIADSQKGKSIIIRTFDVGGDKPLPFFPLPKEENPIMGLRGVRNYDLAPGLFRSQVRAIMRVKPYMTAKIMLPMISFVDEVEKYRAIIKEEQISLGIQEVSVGIMVEVPSAAIMANTFAGYVDFMSLGTNDLTQYVLAIDRGARELSARADSLNPAVLKMIYQTAEAGKAANIPVGVCGAIASDIQAVPILLGLGLRSLSVSGALIADVKYLIRNLDVNKCRDLALKALNMRNSREVRTLIKENFKF